jgi:uncharacterized surface protein with fasciclin (FAS1) repeats
MNWCAAIAAAAFTIAFAPATFAQTQIYAPSGVTVTTTSSGTAIVQTPNVPDFTVLVNPNYDYMDLNQASQAGLSDDEIAAAAMVADRSRMSFKDAVRALQRGETYASLADRTGIPLGAFYDLSDEKARIATFKEAFQNTGAMGMRTMVKGAKMVRYIINGQPVIADRDLVQLARSSENLTTFARAIQVAGLDRMLRGPGPFTIFAPSDSAFSALPGSYVDSLFQDKDRLRQVLQYHILPGRIDSSTAMAMTTPTTPPTLEGSTLQATTNNGSLMINGARVVIPDLVATNGIIHIIDTVLTPPSLIPTTPQANPAAPTTTIITPPSGTTTITPPAGSTTIITPNSTTITTPPSQ